MDVQIAPWLSVGNASHAVACDQAAFGAQVVERIDAHGWRTGRVVDPAGHHWECARRLAR
jgi:uncharacterized glyoxalase superfamily protein PhnB